MKFSIPENQSRDSIFIKKMTVLTGHDRRFVTEVTHSLREWCHENGKDVCYIPADRSGLVLASTAIQWYRSSQPYAVMEDRSPIVDDLISLLSPKCNQPRNKCEDFLRVQDEIQGEILGGASVWTKHYEGGITTLQVQTRDVNGYRVSLSMEETPSEIRSLIPLLLWLQHHARKGSYLIFEEPEANLAPWQQGVLARILCGLCSLGVKVVLATYSVPILDAVSSTLRNSDEPNLKVKDVSCYKFKKRKVFSIVSRAHGWLNIANSGLLEYSNESVVLY